jgi:hypothetical protein
MPYIKQEQREELEPLINELASKIQSLSDKDKTAFAGLLNYACTCIALKTIPEKRYWAIAATTGALRNAAEEFYRRYGVPYEDEMIKTNGDVY